MSSLGGSGCLYENNDADMRFETWTQCFRNNSGRFAGCVLAGWRARSIRRGGYSDSRDGWGVRSHIPRPGLDSHKINNSCEDAGRWYENKLVGMCFSNHCCDELCVEWSISQPSDLPASTCIAISARFLSVFDSLILTKLLLLNLTKQQFKVYLSIYY